MHNIAPQYRPQPVAGFRPDASAMKAAKPSPLKVVDAGGGGPIPPVALEFDRDALLPHISANTMNFHFDKHYMGYLDKTNALLAGSDMAGLCLEEVIRRAAKGRKRKLLSNAAQAWNHGFFWKSLSAARSSTMGALLERAIIQSFGSLEKFREQFIAKGTAHLGSGWIWLSHEQGKGAGGGLVISTTKDATPVWLGSGRTPLLVCDLWEHAYYLDWQNDRAGYLKGFIHELADWNFASRQFAAISGGQPAWAYPMSR